MPSEQANQTRQPTENLQEGRTATKNIVLMSNKTDNSATKI